MSLLIVAQTLHHLCRATLVALHCVAFFAFRFRSVARESRYTPQSWPSQEPPPSPFWQLTRTMVWVNCRGGNSDHGLSFLFSTDLQHFWILAVQILRGPSFGLSFLILWGWGWFPHRRKVSQKRPCRTRLGGGGVTPRLCTVWIIQLCRGTGGVAATVSRVALHCATKVSSRHGRLLTRS